MNLKSILIGVAFSILLVTCTSAAEFVKEHAINKDSDCSNPSGNEVNRSVTIKAPSGVFFEKESVNVYPEADFRSFTDAAGTSGCFIRNAKTELLPVETKNGHKVNIPVLTTFDVYGHSDCGSGEARTLSHKLKGERIRTDCSVKAQTYTVDDLK